MPCQTRVCFTTISFRFMAATIGMWGQEAKLADRPISIHPQNPRYFLWRNQPTVLVASGEHFAPVIHPDFDDERYLGTIGSSGLNHTRHFLGD